MEYRRLNDGGVPSKRIQRRHHRIHHYSDPLDDLLSEIDLEKQTAMHSGRPKRACFFYCIRFRDWTNVLFHSLGDLIKYKRGGLIPGKRFWEGA